MWMLYVLCTGRHVYTCAQEPAGRYSWEHPHIYTHVCLPTAAGATVVAQTARKIGTHCPEEERPARDRLKKHGTKKGQFKD